MKSLVLMLSLLFIVIVAFPSQVKSETPLGGLTVAASPAGKQVVCGGDNRTLYVINEEDLKVVKRIWLGSTIRRMAYNADGSKLWVNGSDNILYLIDTSNWKTLKEFRNLGLMVVGGDTVAANESFKKKIRIMSANDGSEITSFEYDSKKPVEHFGLSQDGKQLVTLTRATTDPGEKKVSYNKIPKDLRGIERSEFERKNDGKTSMITIYDIANKKKLQENTIYYTTSLQAHFSFSTKGVAIVTYDNVNANVDADGNVKMFKLDSGYNYGAGVHGNEVAAGGLRKITIAQPSDESSIVCELDKLPGWPEYLKGFAKGPNGKWYAATSGYRLSRIAEGKIEKTVPVF